MFSQNILTRFDTTSDVGVCISTVAQSNNSGDDDR
jgi:hypothetical protein